MQEQFQFEPTKEQKEVFSGLSVFLFEATDNGIFLLRGYAGTGKTTMVGALVKTLPHLYKRSVLLAPTGRAAKVMSVYSGKSAFTIHKKIYAKETKAGFSKFVLMKNLHKGAIFIVDEASMIAVNSGLKNAFSDERNLLDDLVKYVNDGENCQLIIVGDTAQLPPVMEEKSFALDENFLARRYYCNVHLFELKTVMRQMEDSGILFNSFQIRNQQKQANEFPAIYLDKFEDCNYLTGDDLEDELESNISKYGPENCIVITRSNKRANLFNQQIRTRILWQEEEVSASDLMMIVKNNYYWLDDKSKAGFIANGDIVEIIKVLGYEDMYGHRFANVICKLTDYQEEQELEVKILLDTIMMDTANMPRKEQAILYKEIEKDYIEFSDKRKRAKKVLDNPYFNALQVKFAYSVTCHKSQGGQWPVVFIDQGYLTEEMLDKEYLRWLYTAITRAQEKVYFINFHKAFFPELKEK